MSSDTEEKYGPAMATLGMFIVDTFEFYDAAGARTGPAIPPQESYSLAFVQIGGGGTYAVVGARIWLPPHEVGGVIDRGDDFPTEVQEALDGYGSDMWLYRDNSDRPTTKSRNTYRAGERSFEYLTPRIQLTPRDFVNTKLARARALHLICAPSRAASIVAEVHEVPGWTPEIIYEPVEYACVPEEYPGLVEVLPHVSILSPNAGEALRLLSIPHDLKSLNRPLIEESAHRLLSLGVGSARPKPEDAAVIIRSAELGAYAVKKAVDGGYDGRWVEAYWTKGDESKVVDVTGAGNSFLGGVAAGLHLSKRNVYEATLYGSVSASFVIEQQGLPKLTTVNGVDMWNGELPRERLQKLRDRHR